MAQHDYADLDVVQLWGRIIETMEEGLAAGDGVHAPAGPFREVEAMFDELVRRDPGWNFSEIAEFRTILELALKGERGFQTGHA